MNFAVYNVSMQVTCPLPFVVDVPWCDGYVTIQPNPHRHYVCPHDSGLIPHLRSHDYPIITHTTQDCADLQMSHDYLIIPTTQTYHKNTRMSHDYLSTPTQTWHTLIFTRHTLMLKWRCLSISVTWLPHHTHSGTIAHMTVLIPPNCWKNCNPQPTNSASSTVLLVQNLLPSSRHPETIYPKSVRTMLDRKVLHKYNAYSQNQTLGTQKEGLGDRGGSVPSGMYGICNYYHCSSGHLLAQ